MLLLASSASSCSLRYFLVACVLVSFVVLVVLTSLLVALFCRSMAHMKKTVRLVEGSDVADSGSDVMLSFEFGLSRVTSSDLDDYAKATWFARDSTRPSRGETVPDPKNDKVVIFKEFFEARLRFSPHPLVISGLKRFNLKFHQLNPSSFVKLSIYVWGCKSQGVEPDLEGFI